MKSALFGYLIILLFIFGLFGCNKMNQQLGEHLSDLNEKESCKIETSLNRWHIKHFYEDQKLEEYRLYRKNADTIIEISFIFNKNSNKYENIDLNKFFYSKDDSFYYSIHLNCDTLYIYRQRSLSSSGKEFLIGKYYYLYKFNHLNSGQKVYFEEHMDSLINVKGNDLPKLPSYF